MLIHVESLPLIQAPLLQAEDWLTHGFGLKNISIERYLGVLGFSEAHVSETQQTHGRQIHIISGKTRLEGDAFLTDQPGLVCHVRSADCVPILLADLKHHVVGAVHAGWRGTAQKIVHAAIETMQGRWQTEPADLKAAIGPAIGGHCYEVGEEVAKAFAQARFEQGDWMEEIWHDRWYLDLAFANSHLLRQAGVPGKQIYVSLACTACDLAKFASHRKAGKRTGRQISFIMIR